MIDRVTSFNSGLWDSGLENLPQDRKIWGLSASHAALPLWVWAPHLIFSSCLQRQASGLGGSLNGARVNNETQL